MVTQLYQLLVESNLASYSDDSCDNLNGTSLVPGVFRTTGGSSESSLASASCLEDCSLGFFFLLADIQ